MNLFHNIQTLLSKPHRNDPKFSDRYVWANNADPDQNAPRGEEQSDQGLHCLLFRLHLLDKIFYGMTSSFEF